VISATHIELFRGYRRRRWKRSLFSVVFNRRADAFADHAEERML
jgi:hypothetical protein